MKQTPTPSQFRQDARLRIVTAFFRYLDESRVTETFASDLYDKVTDQIELLHHQGVEEAKQEIIKDALKAIKKYYSFEGDTDWEQIHWQDFKGILEGVLKGGEK